MSVESAAGESTAHALSAVYALCTEGLNSGRTRQCAPGAVTVCAVVCSRDVTNRVYHTRALGQRVLGAEGTWGGTGGVVLGAVSQ